MPDEQRNTRSSEGWGMNESLPPSVEAAVRLENRLTRIEAAQQASHTSIDSLLNLVGELKGIMLDRFKLIDEHDERQDRAIEAQRDAYNLHIAEVETIGSRGRLDVLEDKMRKVEDRQQHERGHEDGAAAVNKRDLAIVGGLFTVANIFLKPLIERLFG